MKEILFLSFLIERRDILHLISLNFIIFILYQNIFSKYIYIKKKRKKEKKKEEALKHDVNRRQIDVWLILIYAFWRHQSKGMIST
jgi:preprotein translocase subunit YajC